MSVIPIFVASTLRDFHQERDLLRRQVAPRLSDEVAADGCRVEFVDLRWGATESDVPEEVREERILAVCAREIDRSRPIMLGLLGTSYGRPFASDRFRSDQAERLPEEIRARLGTISVTEFELLYGLHASEDTEVVVLARQVIGAVDERWREGSAAVGDLQRRLRRSDRVSFRPYRAEMRTDRSLDLAAFEREVLRALLPRVRRRAAEIASGDPYLDGERLLMAENSDPVGLEATTEGIVDRLTAGGTVVVASPRVVGKTAVFADVVTRLRRDGKRVASVSVGVGSVHTLGGLVAALLRQLAPVARDRSLREDEAFFTSQLADDEVEPEHMEMFGAPAVRADRRRIRTVANGKWIAGYASQYGYTCVAVDGIDRLQGSHEDRALAWELFEPVRDADDVGLLFITGDDRSGDGEGSVTVPPLSPADAGRMLEAAVRRSGRAGVPARVTEIVGARERSPLWVSTVHGLIDGLGGDDLAVRPGADWSAELDAALTRVVESLPDEDDRAVIAALDRVVEAVDSDAQAALRDLLEVLALASGGLTARVLGEVLGVDPTRVAALRHRLSGPVTDAGPDRAVRFAHPSVARLLASRIEADRVASIHGRIARALLRTSGTRAEAVALVRHGLESGEAGLAADSLERAVGILGQLGTTARSIAVEIVGPYFDVALRRPVAVDVERMSEEVLGIMVDVVLRRLDRGYSAAPTEGEWPFLDALVDRVEREDLRGGAIPRHLVVDLLDEVAMRYFRIAAGRKDLPGASARYWRMLEAAKRELDEADPEDATAALRFAHLLPKVSTGALGYIDPARRDRLVDEFVAVQTRMEDLLPRLMSSEDPPSIVDVFFHVDGWRESCAILSHALGDGESGDEAAVRAAELADRSDAWARTIIGDADPGQLAAEAVEAIWAGVSDYATGVDRLPGGIGPLIRPASDEDAAP